MSERIALIGFVPTEEILADTMRRQTPDVIVDGYELFPNEAFGRAVDNRYKLYDFDSEGELNLDGLARLRQLPDLGYAAINLGPDTAVQVAGETLDDARVEYVGPRRNELEIETDKTRITEVFPEKTRVLPPTHVIEKVDMAEVHGLIDQFGGKAVLKFVGEYPDYYEGSEYRRVRMSDDFTSSAEMEKFLRHSVDSSGKAIIQKRIEGQEFSFSCLVDGNGAIFSLGENIFYKNRFEGDKGPLCDGTGSVTVNNTLPGIVTPEAIDHIKENIVTPYLNSLAEQFGRAPKTFLNVDLMKATDGQIYLLEVNNRQAGGHTMANLLSGLETPIAEALQATQEDRLHEVEPRYKEGASVVVSVFPENSPRDFESDDERPVIVVPKLQLDDDVRIYTGWVDVLEETDESTTVQTNLTATLLFENHAENVDQARLNVYSRIGKVISAGYTYRSDIGLRYS